MSKIYSTRFVAESFTTTGTVSYTVPTGYVAVLRDVSADLAEADTSAGARLNGVQFWQDGITDVPAYGSGSVQWSGRLVAVAGDELTFFVAGEGGIVASGYLLTTP